MSALSSSGGITTFVDNMITLLAARYNASLDDEECGWEEVSKGVSQVIRHPVTEDERIAVRHVDPFAFTPEICFHRAQYLRWKAEKQREEQTGKKKSTTTTVAAAPRPSGFDVTKHSISKDIELLMSNVRNNLPSTIGDGGESEEDDETPIVLHEFHHKTEEQVARDVAMAEAEDELFQRIQQLQLDFFKKHRKWVDAPLMDNKQLEAASTSPSKSSAPKASSRTNRNILDMTTDDIALVLDELDLSEHKDTFRRVTGAMLLRMDRPTITDGFGGDRDAANTLWFWMQDKRAENQKAERDLFSKMSAVRQPSSGVQSSTKDLQEFQRAQNIGGVQEDPLAMLKRSINPSRPPRPSQDDQYEAFEDPDDIKAIGAAFLSAVEEDAPAKKDIAPAVPSRMGGGGGGGSTASKPLKETAPPPSRANRWAIQEYEDDDEETDEDED